MSTIHLGLHRLFNGDLVNVTGSGVIHEVDMLREGYRLGYGEKDRRHFLFYTRVPDGHFIPNPNGNNSDDQCFQGYDAAHDISDYKKLAEVPGKGLVPIFTFLGYTKDEKAKRMEWRDNMRKTHTPEDFALLTKIWDEDGRCVDQPSTCPCFLGRRTMNGTPLEQAKWAVQRAYFDAQRAGVEGLVKPW